MEFGPKAERQKSYWEGEEVEFVPLETPNCDASSVPLRPWSSFVLGNSVVLGRSGRTSIKWRAEGNGLWPFWPCCHLYCEHARAVDG